MVFCSYAALSATYIHVHVHACACRDGFEREVVGSSFDTLRSAVSEHSAWLRSNCDSQLAYYRAYAAQRAVTLQQSGEKGRGRCQPCEEAHKETHPWCLSFCACHT